MQEQSYKEIEKDYQWEAFYTDVIEDMDDLSLVPSANAGRCSSGVEGLRDVTSPIEKYPSKLVAVHRVRWNFNKGSERWLCYSGAAGIVRCQEITSVFAT